MAKTYLDCYVTNCVYNANRCCGKGDIQVQGADATVTEETCCGSFKERKEGTSNACGSMSKDIKITCEAHNCRFNEDKECTAEHISVAGSNASDSKETECASFDCGC